MRTSEERGKATTAGAQYRLAFAAACIRSQPDRRLVLLFREGHDVAFDEIVRRYRLDLVRHAGLIVSRDHADDVVQEALERAYVALRGPTPVLRLKPWLIRIVRNRALNHRRDEPVHQPLREPLTASVQRGADPEPAAQVREELTEVVSGLKKLPRGQREALVMHELEGRSHDQIATALGASRGAVRQLVFRGRTALRNGVGIFVPLPLVRYVIDAEKLGAGAAAGGTLAGGAGAGSAAGGGIAAKATAGIAAVALAAGAGATLGGGADGRPMPPAPDSGVAPDGGAATARSADRTLTAGPALRADGERASRPGPALVSARGGGRRGDDGGDQASGNSSQDQPTSHAGGEPIYTGGPTGGGAAASGEPVDGPAGTDDAYESETDDEGDDSEYSGGGVAGVPTDDAGDEDDLPVSASPAAGAVEPDDDEDDVELGD
jgi:RNA polymerase sigma-70 factor, ECF subfamily